MDYRLKETQHDQAGRVKFCYQTISVHQTHRQVVAVKLPAEGERSLLL